VIPFRLCFDEDATGALGTLEDIMDISFMIDIIVTFNTGFYKKGYLVMKRKEIVKNYLKTWFLIDLVSSFPYSWVFNAETIALESDTTGSSSSAQYKKIGQTA
jgi:hypothetical protein